MLKSLRRIYVSRNIYKYMYTVYVMYMYCKYIRTFTVTLATYNILPPPHPTSSNPNWRKSFGKGLLFFKWLIFKVAFVLSLSAKRILCFVFLHEVDKLNELTTSNRLAFGSFVDKVVAPYSRREK